MKLEKVSCKRTYFKCLCDECGDLFNRKSESRHQYSTCRACSNKKAGEKRSTHRESCKNSRLYVVWGNMKQRCSNPNNKRYPRYGARGIKVCDQWLASYESFSSWARSNGYADNLTIDRVDNNNGYSPENCRFVDKSVQNVNRSNKAGRSGYLGVEMVGGRFRVYLDWKRKRNNLGYFSTIEEAVKARNDFIIDNDLPHEIQCTKSAKGCDSVKNT